MIAIPRTPRRIWALLTPSQHRAAIFLFGFMILGTLLETLGIGLVIPTLALFTQEDAAAQHTWLLRWLPSSGTTGRNAVIVGGMLILVAVYLIKNAFLGYLAWRQNNFSFGVISSLSQRLFNHYLRQPYTFHLQRNSAELIRNVIGEIDVFTGSVLKPSMQLLAESLTLVGLITLVIAVEPVGALIVAGVAAVASSAFYYTSRSHVARWGEARQRHGGLRLQHLQQGLGGAKEIKLLGREADFIEHFRLHTDRYIRVSRLQNTLLEIPRLWLELLAIGGLATIVITMIVQGKTAESILPTLGLFAAAAFRLMPGLSRILGALQSLRFGLPVIDTLQAELADAPSMSRPAANSVRSAIPFREALVLDRVSFRYPQSPAVVLPAVSMIVPAGSLVGIIGESGSGKTTLVDVILGLLPPDSGTVVVDGIDINSNVRAWQDQIGYVPQSIFLTDDTLRRNVAFGLANEQIDDDAVWRALCAAQLETFVTELPEGLNSIVGERGVRLSGGQRQRIGIARALYHDPAVLVLDEATSSVDVATEEEVMKAVRALHGTKTIIMVSHRLSTVEECDRLYRLERGMIMPEPTILAANVQR